MMTRIQTKAAAGSKAIPIALILTLALALGVWVVPMPFLRAKKQEIHPRETPGATTQLPDGVFETKVKTHDWIALTAGLESIRKPPPAYNIYEESPDAEETIDSEVTTAANEHLPPLTWQYIGYIAQPNGRIAAALRVEDGTRMVYTGAELQDFSDPRQRTVKVGKITRESITLKRAGKDLVLDLEPPQGTEGFEDFTDPDS